jgi:hypothetical protein
MQHKLVARLRYPAALAGIAVLATACGSGASPASSGASYVTDPSVALARLVQCLHAHGEQGVYLSHRPSNPRPGYTLIVYHGCAVQDADPGPAQFAAAAQCMRSHGYPAWPDPTDQNGSNTQAIPAGIDMNSPQYQTAARACGVSLPSGGG